MKYVFGLFLLFACASCETVEQAPNNMPKTCDKAVDILMTMLTEDDLSRIQKTTKPDLFLYHHGLGTTIRNEFGLWTGNPSLMKDCNRIYPDDAEPWHPDSVSMMIIEHLWKRLNTKP